jgi:hypothetical protein
MMERSAHAQNSDLSAAAEIFANGTYFPNTLRRFCVFHVILSALAHTAKSAYQLR